MNARSEKHVSRTQDYTTTLEAEEIDNELSEVFENLDEELYGVQTLDQGTDGYQVHAANSQVNINYDAENSGSETELYMEFSGAAPLVDRIYNHFTNEVEDELDLI